VARSTRDVPQALDGTAKGWIMAAGGMDGEAAMIGRHDCRRVLRGGLVAMLLLVAWGGPPAQAQAVRAIGSVSELTGDCRISRAGATAAQPLAVGTALYEGDRVRTAADARAKLELIDGSVLQLGAGTDLVLDWFLYAPEEQTQNVVLRASAGILRVIAQLVLPRSAWGVQTPTAAASVRGTDWILEATPDATAIVTLEGAVTVRNVDDSVPGEVVLEPGEGVTVVADTPPPTPTVWGDARRESFIARTTVP
jgi:ferric-dicitrate binding protein FerR (iron transport regulator)